MNRIVRGATVPITAIPAENNWEVSRQPLTAIGL